MKIETNGYGASMIATKYVYDRISEILTSDIDEDLGLSKFLDELAHNYSIDTGKKITEKI